jgi:hypothetical protein
VGATANCRASERILQLPMHLRVEAVELVGTIQRQPADSCIDVE